MAKPASSPAPASDQDIEQLTLLFSMLSDPTRLRILMLLAKGERNVISLVEELKLPHAQVNKRLCLLRRSKVLKHRRQGRQVLYSLPGQGASGKDCILEFGAPHLFVRILSNGKG